jgi:hypothetical protein
MRRGLLAILAAALLLTMYSVAASQPTTFTGLGILAGGVFDSDVFDISQDGQLHHSSLIQINNPGSPHDQAGHFYKPSR